VIQKSTIKKSFEISFEHRGGSLSYEEENVKTMFELQKIPKMLAEIRKEISNLKHKDNSEGTTEN